LRFDIDIAMNNSYEIIFKNKNLNNYSNSKNSYFVHNPNEKVTQEVLKDMYIYFLGKKEWRRCFKIGKKRVKIRYQNEI